jgi:hypothetical protein
MDGIHAAMHVVVSDGDMMNVTHACGALMDAACGCNVFNSGIVITCILGLQWMDDG